MARSKPTPSTSNSASRVPASPEQNPNRLLSALDEDDYSRVRKTLAVAPTQLKQLLHKPGEPVREVYFPGIGFCSVLAVLEDGRMIEVATVGREGVLGTAALLDHMPATHATMVQAEMSVCFKMSAFACREEMNRKGAFYELLTLFTQALLGFVMQSAACNAVHTVEERLARWLLMARDRVEADEFPLTQEFAAMMLGATRPTVSVVAGTLQRAGLITYRRGVVTILDREALEEAACECYRTATTLINSVTGSGPSLRSLR
jgi:CRP-like cAMP-binding protein